LKARFEFLLIIVLISVLSIFIFSKSYTIEELLKLAEVNAQYTHLERKIIPINDFQIYSKLGFLPFENPMGELNFKISFFDSLHFFSNLEYYSPNLGFESGVEWDLLKKDNQKDILRDIISKKLEVVDAYFNILRIRNNIKRLKKSIDQSKNMWNSTIPIDYGLSRIEENYLIERLKIMCGIGDKLEFVTPKTDISSLNLNLNSVLNTVIYLNKQEKNPPEISVVFSLSGDCVNSDLPRLNAGFKFNWDNTELEQDNLTEEILKVRKLYSQFEYLKDMLQSYQKNLSILKKDSPEYRNVVKIIEDYTVESYRLYYQLKILEEIGR